MPHKKNPISGENLTGIARVIRSHVNIAHDNIPLWHERDISHSSAERMMLPDNLGLVYYALKRMGSTVENLVVHENKIEAKVLENFTYLSSYMLHLIIEKMDIAREEIYPIVQQASFESKSATQFIQRVSSHPKLKGLDLSVMNSFDASTIKKLYLSQTEKVFNRVFETYPL